MATNNGKFAPEHKKPGDLILSDEWNAGMQEAVRLESAKVNRRGGDSLQGPLTIESALAVDANATNLQLEVKGALKLADGVPVNQFSSDASLSTNSDWIVPTQKAVKTYVNEAVKGREDIDFVANNLAIYGRLVVIDNIIATSSLKFATGVAVNEFSSELLFTANSDSIVPTQKAVKTYVDTMAATLKTAVQATIIKGMILMWSGQIDQIPRGWAICNGQNGTPNLTDKFIVGAGNSYQVEATGGAATVTLTIEQMPAHSHKYSTSFNHSHQSGRATDCVRWDGMGLHDTSNNGGNQPHENRPPYHALAFIMKL